uniref:Uncharacterized protein n=1 Tax=Glossina pallidipes TaxID=7398 RepID=A0A1B0AC64_GLOPL
MRNSIDNLSLQQLETKVRELSQRLQQAEEQRSAVQHQLEECDAEKELYLNARQSGENQSFVQEIVHDVYGQSSVIKGVQSYNQICQTKLVKTGVSEMLPYARRTGIIEN